MILPHLRQSAPAGHESPSGASAVLLDRLETLRAEASDRPAGQAGRDVGNVLVVASGSRNGSSLLADLLRQVPGLLHLPAEMTPLWHLAGLTRAEGAGDSDALDASALSPGARAVLDREVALQCGRPDSSLDRERFALDLACRLTLQWTGVPLRLEQVRRAMEETLAEMGWPEGEFRDRAAFHQAFLPRLGLDPAFYDLPGQTLPAGPAAPPSDPVAEEAPFVTVGPWARATPEEMTRVPLVLKTAADAYRLEALRGLFPKARLRLLHLTRNAAASVNGLYDGWRHPAFWSHRLERPLDIRGYSDICGLPARRWWKFDLPPGWRDRVRSPLEEVCAFQWRSAHRAILDFRARHPEVSCLRMRFEDLVGPPGRRREVLEDLEAWLGLPLAERLGTLLGSGPRPVMATRPPRPGRWRERQALLEPVVRAGKTLELMEALGYGTDPSGWL